VLTPTSNSRGLSSSNDDEAARRATEMLERQKKLRAHVRPKDHEDDTVLLHGEYVSRAERQQYNDYVANMTIYQRFTIFKISVMLRVRHSFIHGKFRRYLTYMALYAAGCEIMHDLHLTHYMQPEIAQFLRSAPKVASNTLRMRTYFRPITIIFVIVVVIIAYLSPTLP